MTAPEQEQTRDAVAEFRAALTPRVRDQLHHTARVAALAHRAVHTWGWTPDSLAKECMRDHNGAINPAGIVMHRLEHCAETGPPGAKSDVRRAFCSPECRENAGMLLDSVTLLPIGKCACRTQPTETT
jgi:hypothetical protein